MRSFLNCLNILIFVMTFQFGSADQIIFGFMAMTTSVPGNSYYLYSNMGAAIPLAIADLRQLPNMLPNETLEFVIQPSECDTKVLMKYQISLNYQEI
jgi:hypothetical protein